MANRRRSTTVAVQCLVIVGLYSAGSCTRQAEHRAEFGGTSPGQLKVGEPGGRLVFSQRTEPKTLNPISAFDASSKQILGLLNADLIHINRASHDTEPALAESWTVSKDLRQYTLKLRSGLHFSDGRPCTVDDVLFSFQVYLDEKSHSSQRNLLMIGGKPVEVQRLGADSIRFSLAKPYAAAERIFDSVFILPKHLLVEAYRSGSVDKAWPLSVEPSAIAGLGPFRLRQYVPGQSLMLERNPYYWKRDSKGQSLPYLNEITAISAGTAQGEAMRFAAGDTDLIDRLSAADFAALGRYKDSRGLNLVDLGPGLEFNFLFFNLNKQHDEGNPKHAFRTLPYRKAVASAIDRQSLVRLAYQGRAYPLTTFVPPADSRWVNRAIPGWRYSPDEARRILQADGFSFDKNNNLQSSAGINCNFSLIYSATNPQHAEMATLIQQDLRQVGISVNTVALEFHSLLDRVFRKYDYEAAIMTLAGEDTDPNSEINIWSSNGGTHVWDLTKGTAASQWQQEIDRLMDQQMVARDYKERKAMYDRVQQDVWENLPILPLVSPHILVGAKQKVENFRPVVLGDHILWDAEHLYIRQNSSSTANPR